MLIKQRKYSQNNPKQRHVTWNSAEDCSLISHLPAVQITSTRRQTELTKKLNSSVIYVLFDTPFQMKIHQGHEKFMFYLLNISQLNIYCSISMRTGLSEDFHEDRQTREIVFRGQIRVLFNEKTERYPIVEPASLFH